MEEKNKKNIGGIILIIIIVAIAFLFYPWFAKVDENGETVCSNILGFKMDC